MVIEMVLVYQLVLVFEYYEWCVDGSEWSVLGMGEEGAGRNAVG